MAEDKKVKVIEEEEEGVEEKKVPSTKVYHVSKRTEDKKWTIKFALGSKVIKLCDTKEPARDIEYLM